MKRIYSILIFLLIGVSFSCSDDDDTPQIPNPTGNGFTFNSEFVPTNDLILTGNPGELYFLIIENTLAYNSDRKDFDGDPGQVILINVPVPESNVLMDYEGTYTEAITSSEDEITDVSFVAALLRNVTSIDPIIRGANFDNSATLIANTGVVTVRLNSETLVVTLEYTFTTNEGTITGTHESNFILFE